MTLHTQEAIDRIVENIGKSPKCSCVYATSANTWSVRKGFEMGGYLKKECEACRRKRTTKR